MDVLERYKQVDPDIYRTVFRLNPRLLGFIFATEDNIERLQFVKSFEI
jgi:hypothetical protein